MEVWAFKHCAPADSATMADNHSEGECIDPQSTQFLSQILTRLNFFGLQLRLMVMRLMKQKKETKMNNNYKFLEVDG